MFVNYKSCTIDGCKKEAFYVFEWYGLNQHGENPIVEDERPVCGNIEHMISVAHHENYGGVPDCIVDARTLDIEYPKLLEMVIERM